MDMKTRKDELADLMQRVRDICNAIEVEVLTKMSPKSQD